MTTALTEHDERHIWVVPGYPDKCLCMCARCASPARPADWVYVDCICPDDEPHPPAQKRMIKT